MIREALARVIEGEDLSSAEAAAVMAEIMSGECTDAQIGAFISVLRMKGETVPEIAGCARIMREKATPVGAPVGMIDTCGTGGDARGTFNISTATAIVAAAAGVKVAKHGNCGVSSKSGSADVLTALGVNIRASLQIVERCIDEVGIGFLFAPMLHGAMKYAIGPRREIGIRTIFNILGPLSNPAGARHQLLGVYASTLAPTLALVLRDLGSTRALVVHGHDGLDEISISDETTIAELKDGDVNEYVVAPEEFDLSRGDLEALKVSTPEESAAMIRDVLAGKPGPARDIVLLNAGAALYAAERAEDIPAGLEQAAEAVDSGRATDTLEALARLSNA